MNLQLIGKIAAGLGAALVGFTQASGIAVPHIAEIASALSLLLHMIPAPASK